MVQSKEDKEKQLDIFTKKMQDLYKDIDKNIWAILYEYDRFNYLYKDFYSKYNRYQVIVDIAKIHIERAEEYIGECEIIASNVHYKEDEVKACRKQITHLSNIILGEKEFLQEKEKDIDSLCYEIAKSLKIAASVKDDSTPEGKAAIEQAMDDYVQSMKKFDKDSKIYINEIETKKKSFEDVVLEAHSARDETEDLHALIVPPKPRTKPQGTRTI